MVEDGRWRMEGRGATGKQMEGRPDRSPLQAVKNGNAVTFGVFSLVLAKSYFDVLRRK
jgi:hypothetical protein